MVLLCRSVEEEGEQVRRRWMGGKEVEPGRKSFWEVCEIIWALITVALCVYLLYWVIIGVWGWISVGSKETAHETPLTEKVDSDLTMT